MRGELRVLQGNYNTNKWVAKLREVISGMTLKEAAERLSISQAKLSRVLNGAYPNAEEEAKRLVSEWETHSEKSFTEKAEFETSFQRQARIVMELCLRFKKMGVVTAPSGCGKTYVSIKFKKEKGNQVFYFRPTEVATTGSLLEALGEALQIKTTYGTLEFRLKRIIKKLAERGTQLVIVDEADVLGETKRPSTAVKMFAVFRQIAEAGIGVVLVGLPSLREHLKTLPGYMTNRMVFEVDGREPDEEELLAFLRMKGVPEDPKVIASCEGAGFFRYLDMYAQLIEEGLSAETAYAVLWRG